MNNLAPIVLFVYNRPWHTRQTLEALSKNILADQSTLYIYSDGPKKNATILDLNNIKEVQKLIRKTKWCKEVHITVSDKNKGLANSIINGVTEIVNKFGKIIVLEDDIVTSSYFLKYMNNALELYKDEEKVMHISGYWFPVKNSEKLPEIFFYNPTTCWGWGTWKQSWKKLETNSIKLKEKILEEPNSKYRFNIKNGYNFLEHLEMNISGEIKTWAVKWYATVFLNKGLSLHPNKSFVNNIGHDDSGVHCGKSDIVHWSNLSCQPKILKITLLESKLALTMIKKQFNKHQNKWMNIIKNTIPRTLKDILKLIFIKEKFFYLKKIPRFQEKKITFFNKKITLVDSASFLSMYKEIFENEIYEFRCMHDTPHIIDCGANIGLSIIYFKKLYPKSNIIAFEPDQKIFDVLTHNIQNFEITDTTLINKGLWNKKKNFKFFSEGADSGRIAIDEDKNNITEIEVISLRPFLENRNVDLLKIDIEGAETIVLEDIADLLDNVDRIFIEYHSFTKKKQSINRILNIMSDNNYRVYISPPGLQSNLKQPFYKLNEYSGMDMQLNIFCIKNNSGQS